MANLTKFHEHGWYRLVELRFEAWYEEQASTAECRILDAHARRIDKRHMVATAEFTARRDVERLRGEVDMETYERSLWNDVQLVSPEERRALLEHRLNTERLLLALADLKRQRTTGRPDPVVPIMAAPAKALPLETADEPAIGPYLSDAQIHALALKPLLRFSHLSEQEADRAWKHYHDELRSRFPKNIAEEIARRIAELRAAAS